jgi:plastocyanin
MNMTAIRATLLTLSLLVVPLLLGAKGASVLIDRGGFSPASVEVQVGDTVTWVNNDDRDHTVVGDGFRSGNLRPGASYSYQFNKPGKFSYGSSIYPRMKGTVIVKEK